MPATGLSYMNVMQFFSIWCWRSCNGIGDTSQSKYIGIDLQIDACTSLFFLSKIEGSRFGFMLPRTAKCFELKRMTDRVYLPSRRSHACAEHPYWCLCWHCLACKYDSLKRRCISCASSCLVISNYKEKGKKEERFSRLNPSPSSCHCILVNSHELHRLLVFACPCVSAVAFFNLRRVFLYFEISDFGLRENGFPLA